MPAFAEGVGVELDETKGHEQKIVNDFFRSYVDPMYKNPMNTVRLNSNIRMSIGVLSLNAVMLSGPSQGVPFWTEVRLKRVYSRYCLSNPC